MQNVSLGFLELSECWRLNSNYFPSKIGGKPAWLSLKPLPTIEELSCEKCGKIMIFLCQIYAPFEDDATAEQQEMNFHRTIFIFLCKNKDCNIPDDNNTNNIKVFRSSLPKQNDFYPIDPPEYNKNVPFDLMQWVELCSLCGIPAHQKCGKCKTTSYCCKDHQIIDWKNGHKIECSSHNEQAHNKSENKLNILYSEFELVNEIEEIKEDNLNEKQAITEFEKLKVEGKTGTLDDSCISDLDAHAAEEIDKIFAKFKKRIEHYPEQVLRYQKGGKPLLIAKEPSVPQSIPKCEYCRSPRQFEFQIMPQMLYELKEDQIDWGVLLIYTCKNSCIGQSINSYKKEYVIKQDVHSDNLDSRINE